MGTEKEGNENDLEYNPLVSQFLIGRDWKHYGRFKSTIDQNSSQSLTICSNSRVVK